MTRYNLANYLVSITPNDTTLQNMFPNVVIGGEGSMMDTITISRDNDMWSTTGFSTGGWVHNKNLSKIGKVLINISQLSERIARFKQMCEVYYGADYDGFTLSVMDNSGRKVCTCIDCYVQKIPDQRFGPTADMQEWGFTCGEVNYN